MVTTPHNVLTGPDLHQPFGYVNTTDPGAVGAGAFWLDTSSEPLAIKRRNDTNTAWIAVGSAGAAGGSKSTWEIGIEKVSGTYRAYDRSGAEINANSALHTLWNAVRAVNRHIHFGPGLFEPTSEMVLLSGMRVSGDGWATLFNKVGTGNVFSMTGAIGAHITNCRLHDFQITGPSAVGAQIQGIGVTVGYCDNFEIYNVWGSGFGSLGDDGAISLDKEVSGGWVHHCRLWNSKNGLCAGSPTASIIQCSDCVFDHNMAYDNWDDGMHSQRCSRMMYHHNICYDNANGGSADGAGIDTLGDEHDLVSHNICYGNDRGIECGNTAEGLYPDIGNIYDHNQCYDNVRYGMTIIGASEDCLVDSNEVYGNGLDGIRCGTAVSTTVIKDVLVTNNKLKNNGTSGIDFFGYVQGFRATGNDSKGHSTADIRVRVATGTPDDYVIVNNFLKSATGLLDAVADAGSVTTPNYT